MSYHRGREWTRRSAVQRLVERKLAQKEKEKEKERECLASQHKQPSIVRSDYYYRWESEILRSTSILLKISAHSQSFMTIYCGHEEFLDIHESFLFQGLRQIWNKIRERIHPLSRKMFFTEQGKSFLRKLTPDLEMNVVVSKDITHDQATLHAENRPRLAAAKNDSNSVSTVSGSGRDFFRKFVSRKDSSYKDCEEHFRREVLIDRLVSDSINTKAILARTRSSRSSTVSLCAASALQSSEAKSTDSKEQSDRLRVSLARASCSWGGSSQHSSLLIKIQIFALLPMMPVSDDIEGAAVARLSRSLTKMSVRWPPWTECRGRGIIIIGGKDHTHRSYIFSYSGEYYKSKILIVLLMCLILCPFQFHLLG